MIDKKSATKKKPSSDDKQIIRDAIHYLKARKIIKYEKDIAEALDYTPGAVSEMLSATSGKPITYSFKQRFKDKFGKYLADNIEPEPDNIGFLEARIKVLEQTCIDLLAEKTGKTPARVSAELDMKVREIMLKTRQHGRVGGLRSTH